MTDTIIEKTIEQELEETKKKLEMFMRMRDTRDKMLDWAREDNKTLRNENLALRNAILDNPVYLAGLEFNSSTEWMAAKIRRQAIVLDQLQTKGPGHSKEEREKSLD